MCFCLCGRELRSEVFAGSLGHPRGDGGAVRGWEPPQGECWVLSSLTFSALDLLMVPEQEASIALWQPLVIKEIAIIDQWGLCQYKTYDEDIK